MKRGFYLVLATALVSGVSIFLNKFAVQGLDPYFFSFSKNVLVAVFLFSMLLLMREWADLKSLRFKQWLQLLIIGLVGGSVPFLLFFKGLQLTSAASASFVHKSMFVFVAVLAAVFLKERISLKFLAGAVLLFVGNLLLVNFAWGFDFGALLVLGATVLWAVENTLSKYVLRELSSRVVAFGRMFFGSLFILIFLFATGGVSQVSMSLAHLKWVLFTSILLLLYAATWYEGLRSINVSTATCILLLGSVVTSLLQLFGGVVPSFAQAAGMVLLVVGVLAVSRQPVLS
ncbi:DMT family transporter [Candidatus Woesearchaeota archaeon]|nr:DMT family transporter [Candidatus Woesearchaeota archaeon]MBW3016407.1 DMT family transporter [Candidatus Woesearchaeota archaeon]